MNYHRTTNNLKYVSFWKPLSVYIIFTVKSSYKIIISSFMQTTLTTRVYCILNVFKQQFIAIKIMRWFKTSLRSEYVIAKDEQFFLILPTDCNFWIEYTMCRKLRFVTDGEGRICYIIVRFAEIFAHAAYPFGLGVWRFRRFVQRWWLVSLTTWCIAGSARRSGGSRAIAGRDTVTVAHRFGVPRDKQPPGCRRGGSRPQGDLRRLR